MARKLRGKALSEGIVQRNQPNSMSKRKAKYDRSDRATYHKTGRKNAARKAAEARWNRSQTTTEALTDVTNITAQLGSRIMDLENLGSGLAEISSHSGHVEECVYWMGK